MLRRVDGYIISRASNLQQRCCENLKSRTQPLLNNVEIRHREQRSTPGHLQHNGDVILTHRPNTTLWRWINNVKINSEARYTVRCDTDYIIYLIYRQDMSKALASTFPYTNKPRTTLCPYEITDPNKFSLTQGVLCRLKFSTLLYNQLKQIWGSNIKECTKLFAGSVDTLRKHELKLSALYTGLLSHHVNEI
jgi:hypothetical protein